MIVKNKHLDPIVVSFSAVMGKTISQEKLREHIVDTLAQVARSDGYISPKTKEAMRRNRDRLKRLAVRFEKVKKELRRELKSSHSLPLIYPSGGLQEEKRKVGRWIESVEDAELTGVAMAMSDAISFVLRRDAQADRTIDFLLHWITIANPRFRRWSSLSELLSMCFGKDVSSNALRMMAKRHCLPVPAKPNV